MASLFLLADLPPANTTDLALLSKTRAGLSSPIVSTDCPPRIGQSKAKR